MCFVDFNKVFRLYDKLWVTMIDKRYPLHLIDLLAKLYTKELAKVKIAATLSDQNGLLLRKQSDKAVSFLRTYSAS